MSESQATGMTSRKMADVQIGNEILEVDQKEENTERNSVDSSREKQQPAQAAANRTEESPKHKADAGADYELIKLSQTREVENEAGGPPDKIDTIAEEDDAHHYSN